MSIGWKPQKKKQYKSDKFSAAKKHSKYYNEVNINYFDDEYDSEFTKRDTTDSLESSDEQRYPWESFEEKQISYS